MSEFTGTVLVLGANGRTGKLTVKHLQDKHIKVRAVVRHADKTSDIKHDGVEIVIANPIDAADLRKVLQGVQAVIWALGGNIGSTVEEREAIEHHSVETLIAECKAARVDRIILVSSIGADAPQSIPFLTEILKLKRKGEMALEASGLNYTIIRPGGLTDDPSGKEIAVGRPVQGGRSISRDDVAEVVVQALLQPEAANKVVEIVAVPGAGAADRAGLFKF